MLFTSYIYVQQKMTNKENHHQMEEGNPKKPKSPNKQLSDSDTLDEESIILSLKPQYRKDIMGQYLAQH